MPGETLDDDAKFSLGRAGAMLALAVLGVGGLIGRVAYLQTVGRAEHVRQADRQQHRQQALSARRGGIFDRNGVLLAGTEQSKVLYADPKFMRAEFAAKAAEEFKRQAENDRLRAKGKKVPTTVPATDAFPGRYAPWNGVDTAISAALAEVADLAGVDPRDLAERVASRDDTSFVKLAVRLDASAAEAIAKLKVPGIGFQSMPVRTYPLDDLASHVLGGISSDGLGLDGLEQKYNRDLSGRDGFLREQTDSHGRPIETAADDYVPPVHGRHLVLTLDANIQMIAEDELRATIDKFGAKRGEVVVMNPWTGEVLALANYPTYPTADYLAFADADKHKPAGEPPCVRDSALVAPYEPGSTIKPFIVSPCVEWKLARLSETFNTYGGHYRTPYGREVSDTHGGYAHLNLWDVLVKSSNIGMAQLAERVGNAKLHDCLADFDFGLPTGIELPGENGGLLKPLPKWNKYSTESVAQGYEIMVTPLQLARGMCALANGGTLLRPTIIKGLVDGEGEVAALPPAPSRATPFHVRQALDATTTETIRRVLADVVVRGTGRHARSDLYNIFGKTGTAHLTEPGKKGYSQEKYTSSFIGAGPYEHPELVVAFIIHEAKKTGDNYFGGTTAAPGAIQTLERSLKYLGTPPSPQLPLPPPDIAAGLYNPQPADYTNWPANIRKERGVTLPTPAAATPTVPPADAAQPIPAAADGGDKATAPWLSHPAEPAVKSVG